MEKSVIIGHHIIFNGQADCFAINTPASEGEVSAEVIRAAVVIEFHINGVKNTFKYETEYDLFKQLMKT